MKVIGVFDPYRPPTGSFPVVTSTTLLREMEPDFGADFVFGFSTTEQIDRGLQSGRATLAQVAAGATADEGVYLSVERLTGAADIAAWIGSLEHAGFGVDFARSENLSAQFLLGEHEHLPALVAAPGAGPVSTSEVLEWLLGDEHIASSELAHEVELKRNPPITLIQGWQADVRDEWGQGSTRLAIFKDRAGRVLLYLTTSRGYRKILGIDHAEPSGLLAEADTLLARFRADPNVQSIRDLQASNVHEF